MKYSFLFASAIAATLAGCASSNHNDKAGVVTPADAASPNQQVPTFEQVIHLAYQCRGSDGKVAPLLVAGYGMVNGEPVAAQLTIGESTSPALALVKDAPNTDTINTFFGNGVTWTTERATLQNIGQAQGIMLTRRQMIEVNGKQEEVDNIMLKDCSVDPAATQSLVQQKAN